jgi:hypothetical protein
MSVQVLHVSLTVSGTSPFPPIAAVKRTSRRFAFVVDIARESEWRLSAIDLLRASVARP